MVQRKENMNIGGKERVGRGFEFLSAAWIPVALGKAPHPRQDSVSCLRSAVYPVSAQ